MILAFGFLTPWLLLGGVAVAIPFVLHLLSNVRAKDMDFPTLRFLQMSMEKTARRRRVQHWLLMMIRAGLLGLLAIAVAEPITQAFGGWMGGSKHAVVVVLDNSYSMGTAAGGTTRLGQAKAQAEALLTGDSPPAGGAVLRTNGTSLSTEMTSDWSALARTVRNTPLSAGRAGVLQKIRQAAKLLDDHDTVSQKSIYVFTDLQRASFEEIASAEPLIARKNIHIMIVNTAAPENRNVGISNIELSGKRIVHSVMEATATIVNSSPGDREAWVGMRVDGKLTGQPRKITLAGAGKDGSVATVRFQMPTGPGPGTKTGEIFLCDELYKPFQDDLELDNVRRFCVAVGGRVKVLIVQGGAGENPAATSTLLTIATDPWKGREDTPWSISPRLVSAGDFKPQDLIGIDAVFATNVAAFTPAQASALGELLSGGGTVMLFLGPDVEPEQYNRVFGADVLPGKIFPAVGQVGPDADAVGVTTVDTADPYLKGLFKERSDYLSPLVKRYFRMDRTGRGSTVLMGLANRDPLMLTKRVGRGRITVCATAASGQWSNFMGSGANVIVSMVIRACLLAPRNTNATDSYLWGAQVPISPKGTKRGSVKVTLPVTHDSEHKTVTLNLNPRGLATFTNTEQTGIYHWQSTGAGANKPGNKGSFAINPNGSESDLRGYSTVGFRGVISKSKLERVYVGQTLKDVMSSAVSDAQPAEWWDVVCILVILLLIVEALVANRGGKTTQR
jgi:hypothetical protein